jgi:hypothetical protein
MNSFHCAPPVESPESRNQREDLFLPSNRSTLPPMGSFCIYNAPVNFFLETISRIYPYLNHEFHLLEGINIQAIRNYAMVRSWKHLIPRNGFGMNNRRMRKYHLVSVFSFEIFQAPFAVEQDNALAILIISDHRFIRQNC